MSVKKNPNLGRRKVLKGTAVGLSAAAFGPWVISPRALASSGEINILMWSDYLPPGFMDACTNETGIKINYTGIGSNEEIINKMKATKGRGVDICSPTNMRSPQWIELELLQAFDYGKIKNLKNVNPAMLKVGDEEWNFKGKGSHWLPHIWGTEAVAWRTDQYSPPGGTPSYGNVWQADVKGKTMMRPHSGMLGAGLYLETIGELQPGDMKRAYEKEDVMRPIWEKVTAFCIKNKDQVKLFWNDADSQKNGFLNDGVVVGQTWDGPPLAMKTAGEPVTYQAPKEGALAWVDGMALSAGAENMDQVYAFLDFCYLPEPAGKAIDDHGYNSAVLGADKHAGDQYKKNFSEAYPGDALSNLWPWPKEPQWYADVRTEYRNKFVNA
ncbi:MAG: extracellular solute-binding protein [Gammaproteobacteria bacterium]